MLTTMMEPPVLSARMLVWGAVGMVGHAALSQAATTSATTTDNTTSSSNNTKSDDGTSVVVAAQLDDQIKPVLTIAAMAVFIIIGFLVAKFVDKWYDKSDPPDDASDCSERTRQLLKQRVVLDVFQDMKESGKLEQGEEELINEVITGRGKLDAEAGAEAGMERDSSISSKKMSKLWMFKTAFMGQKRKMPAKAVVSPEPTASADDATPKVQDEGKEQKIFTLPSSDGKGEQLKGSKREDFIDVQFTHHRVEESFTISKRVPQSDLPEADNPYMYRYQHVSEDVLIPVRMMSPEATAASKVTRKNSETTMPQLGYYAELTLAPTRLGHYADSDFGSHASLDEAGNNKTNNNHGSQDEPDDAFMSQSNLAEAKDAVPEGILRRKSPSPTKRHAHFSTTSTESPTKQNGSDRYEDDFESVSTYDNNYNNGKKRIQTGRTDKTEHSSMSGAKTIGASMPSVGTIGSAETPRDSEALASARRQVNENAAETAAGNNAKPKTGKVETPRQFSQSSTKDKAKAKKITVQPRI